jgi:hypothetical protein
VRDDMAEFCGRGTALVGEDLSALKIVERSGLHRREKDLLATKSRERKGVCGMSRMSGLKSA